MTTVRRARWYDTARTAHVERLETFAPGLFLYTRTRADFDADLAGATPGVLRVDFPRLARIVWSGKLDVLEIPEPLAIRLLPRLLPLTALVALRRRLHLRAPLLVTYAIENLDQAGKLAARTHLPRETCRRLLVRWAGAVTRRVDRLAFGTRAALENYRDLFGEQWEEITRDTDVDLFTPLPQAADVVAPVASSDGEGVEPAGDGPLACFLGTFEERKGIVDLMEAWPLVARRLPGARLLIMGKGEMTDRVEAFAEGRPNVRLLLDPPRSVIAEGLAASDCLVLLSRRTPYWREQIGLPILEALSAGCEIVTTTETGIAAELAEEGHTVLPDRAPAEEVADAIVDRLVHRRPRSQITAVLPEQDGRLAADRWMFADRDV